MVDRVFSFSSCLLLLQSICNCFFISLLKFQSPLVAYPFIKEKDEDKSIIHPCPDKVCGSLKKTFEIPSGQLTFTYCKCLRNDLFDTFEFVNSFPRILTVKFNFKPTSFPQFGKKDIDLALVVSHFIFKNLGGILKAERGFFEALP